MVLMAQTQQIIKQRSGLKKKQFDDMQLGI